VSSVAACVDRIRGTRHAPVPGRAAPRKAHVRRNLRRAGAGMAATLLVYAVLLAVSGRADTFAEAGWMSSAAGRLRPYGAAVAERGVAFAHDTAQAPTWIVAFAPLPLVALSLLWLARRDQRVYVRLATALLPPTSARTGPSAPSP
jgi:hypothetical protein